MVNLLQAFITIPSPSTKVDDKVSWSFESDGINKWYHVVITFDGRKSIKTIC